MRCGVAQPEGAILKHLKPPENLLRVLPSNYRPGIATIAWIRPGIGGTPLRSIFPQPTRLHFRVNHLMPE
jgi:hypothetical protein